MKIAFLIRSLNHGGAERQLVVLARGLHECGHRVVVVVFYPHGPLEAELRAAGIAVHALHKLGRWDVLGFLLRFIRLVREEQPDILHGYLGTPNVITALLKPILRDVRVVWGLRAAYVN